MVIGKLIRTPQSRDAVHIAIAPVMAVDRLKPGEHIGIRDNKAYPLHLCLRLNIPVVAVVDPFLKAQVYSGEEFFALLYPETITSIKHQWTHPSFEDTPAGINPNQHALDYMERFAANYGITLEEILKLKPEDWCGGSDYTNEDFHNNAQFWEYYTQVTGFKVELDGLYIRCAC